MTPFTVAVATPTALPGQNARWDWLRHAATEAQHHGADLLVLPELYFPGYEEVRPDPSPMDRQRLWDLSEPLPGPTTTQLQALADQSNLRIAIGVAERGPLTVFNTLVIVSRQGVEATARKTHLFGAEPAYFEPGRQLGRWDSPWGRAGLLICHDKEFPEVGRTLAEGGARWFLIISAWPGAEAGAIPSPDDTDIFTSYDRVRAAENGVWVVSANYHGGQYQGHPYVGGSGVYNSAGARISTAYPHLAVGRVDLSFQPTPMAALDWVRERRPGLYGDGSRDR